MTHQNDTTAVTEAMEQIIEQGLDTRLGTLQLNIPQVRGDVSLYPSAQERGLRSERALLLAMAEMYVKGVSTRKVQDVLQKLCGLKITGAQVSRACKQLDEEIEKWRNRPWDACRFFSLMQRTKEWEAGRIYLRMSNSELAN